MEGRVTISMNLQPVAFAVSSVRLLDAANRFDLHLASSPYPSGMAQWVCVGPSQLHSAPAVNILCLRVELLQTTDKKQRVFANGNDYWFLPKSGIPGHTFRPKPVTMLKTRSTKHTPGALLLARLTL